MEHRVVSVGTGRRQVSLANNLPIAIIAGPCQLESLDLCLRVAEKLSLWTQGLGMPYIFKGSFDKANRTSKLGARGPGIDAGLRILERVKDEVGCPVTTDIHQPGEAPIVAEVVDLIQIPALLSRQTDLLWEAGNTNLPVNIKKGQFMSPLDIKYAASKVGHEDVLLTERGSTFGYNNLVVDMRGLEQMKTSSHGLPVIIDASHAVQTPSSGAGVSGGTREFVENIARAGVASTKLAGLFFECHPDPDNAMSDGPTSLRLDDTRAFLGRIQMYDEVTKSLG